jgi:hypothetical protein
VALRCSGGAARLIGFGILFAAGIALVGCGRAQSPRALPSIATVGKPPHAYTYDTEKFDARSRNVRLSWLVHALERSEQTVREVSAPALVRRIERAATASGARLLAVTVLRFSEGEYAPVVTLTSSRPAAYMKHDLLGFLRAIGYLKPYGFGFVELLDDHGRFAWAAGRYWPAGGTGQVRPELQECNPIRGTGGFMPWAPPPCPA